MMRCRAANAYIVWDDIVQQRCNTWVQKSQKFLICRLVLGSTVYNLWLTRNKLILVGQPYTDKHILKNIVWDVRTRIARKGKFLSTREYFLLCSMCNLPVEFLI
jgi:hypothetical protein